MTQTMRMLSLKNIQRDTTQFQFRQADFDETRVTWLITNWDEKQLDPLDVWLYEDQYYLISGHHRLEAMQRRGDKKARCRIHELADVNEARTLAAVSNANRLSYSDFEYTGILEFLVEQEGSIDAAAQRLALTVGKARDFYSLRFLRGTEWEAQYEALSLRSRALVVARFCETEDVELNQANLNSLFKVTIDEDLSRGNLINLMKRIKVRLQKEADPDSNQPLQTGALFDLGSYTSNVVAVAKETSQLNHTRFAAGYLFEVLQREDHAFPPELLAKAIAVSEELYRYCVDDLEAVPQSKKIVPVRTAA